MDTLFTYLNPMAHLGEKKYSFLLPLLTLSVGCILSEGFAYGIAKDPMIVGLYAIFIPVALIIYFSFREGIIGGITASIITIIYYFYIIYTRHYKGGQLTAAMKVFERLYQVTDPQEKTFPGLGLGLYISKEIIDRHKRKMWVNSENGKDSTFYFSLPLPT